MLRAWILALLALPLLLHADLQRDLDYARRLQADGVHDLTVEQCRILRERFPDAAEMDLILNLEASSAFALRRFDEARSSWQRLSLNHMDSPLASQAQRRVADCLDSLGRSREAASALRSFAERFPEDPQAAAAMFSAARRQPTGSEKRGLLEAIIGGWPESPEALQARLALAEMDLKLGNTDRAKSACDRVIQLASGRYPYLEARARLQLAALLAADEPALARNLLLADVPGLAADAQLRLKLRAAGFSLEAGRPAEALELLQDLAATAPALSDSLNLVRGSALAALGRFDEAAESFGALGKATLSSQIATAWTLARGATPARAAGLYDELLTNPQAEEHVAWLLDERCNSRLTGPSAELLRKLRISEILPGQPVPVVWTEALLEAGELREASHLLDDRLDSAQEMDERIFLRIRLALAQAEWLRARRELESMRALCPLSPLLPAAEEALERAGAGAQAGTAVQEELLDLMVRQGSGEDPAQLAFEFAEIYHNRLAKPAEALGQYKRAMEGLSGEGLSKAALGVLECQRDLCDTSAVIDFWAQQGELLHQPETVVASLECLWSLEPSPGADALLERARLLAALCDSLDLVAGLPTAFHQTCITALEKQTEVNPADSLALLVLDFHCRDQRQDLALAARALAFGRLAQDSLALETWKTLRLEAPDSPWRIEADLALAAAVGTPDAERLELLESLRRDHAYHPALETAEELRAALLFKSGDFRGALAAWQERALTAHRNQPIDLLPEEGSQYDYSIGMCYEALGQEEDAREAFARYLRGAGRKDRARGEDALLRIAASTARQGDLNQAERLYRNLLAHSPDGPVQLRATRDLARLMAQKGDYAAEAALLNTLNPAASPDAELRTAWVKNLYQRADFDRAKSEFGRLLKDFRDTIDADTVKAAMNWAKGEAQLRAGNRDGAEKSFSLVVRDYRDTRFGLMARWGLARTLVGKGEVQEALGELDQLITQWPESAEAAKGRLLKGRLLYESGDSRAGMRALRELSESQAPEVDRREASLLLVRIYREEGFPDGALQMLLRYLREFPNADDYLARRMEAALLRKDLGELNPAIAEMRELLPIVDTERAAALQFYIGEALQLDGQLRAAILEYLKVPYLAGDTKLDWDVTALYQAGQCWEELGEADRAAELYIDIIRRRGPGSSFGSAAQERINLLRAAGALSGSDKN